MKITPVAAGGTISASAETAPVRTPDKIERAKAIASGQFVETEKLTGDAQVDRIQNNIKKIKMKTQVSTNRDDAIAEPVVEAAPPTQNATSDVSEQVNGTEETRPIDPQVAAFVKAKRALQVKERELAEKEQALNAQQVFNPEEYVSKADLKANRLKVLLENGVTYDQLTEDILNNQSAAIDPVALRNQIKEELKTELTEEFVNRDQAAEQQVLADMTRETYALTAQGEQFEAIRESKAQKKVVDLVHKVWQNGWPDKGYEKGHIMDITEAAELVENQLIEDFTPLARLKKVQSRLTPEQVQQVEKILTTPKDNVKVMRTLTNRDTATMPLDRRARAIAAFGGVLKRG